MLSNNFESELHRILIYSGKAILKTRNYFNIKEKVENEIVTTADVISNNIIINFLKSRYPKIPRYSEESRKSNKSTRWILDPLDGTTPWVFGNSGFSISLALEKDGVVEVGAVYDPVMKEFFFAEKGKGAKRNGQKIKVSNENNLKNMLFVVDWGNKDEKRKEGLEYFTKFFLPNMFARRIVPQFAPSLGLCKIAEGRIHALICNDTWVEDHSAGALILEEAGGFITNYYNTNIFNHRETGIIATNNKEAHNTIVSFLNNIKAK